MTGWHWKSLIIPVLTGIILSSPLYSAIKIPLFTSLPLDEGPVRHSSPKEATNVDPNNTTGIATNIDTNITPNIAIGGYDVVSYFKSPTALPQQGTANHTWEWQDMTWYFVNADNKKAFRKEPERYAPRYGGYCVWGLASKEILYQTSPRVANVFEGHLYMHFNVHTQKKWLENPEKYIEKATVVWRNLMAKSQP